MINLLLRYITTINTNTDNNTNNYEKKITKREKKILPENKFSCENNFPIFN